MTDTTSTAQIHGTSIAIAFMEGAVMTKIRVRYDAYNRQFTLLDRQTARLHDGDTYLIVDTTNMVSEDDSALVSEDELSHHNDAVVL